MALTIDMAKKRQFDLHSEQIVEEYFNFDGKDRKLEIYCKI